MAVVFMLGNVPIQEHPEAVCKAAWLCIILEEICNTINPVHVALMHRVKKAPYPKARKEGKRTGLLCTCLQCLQFCTPWTGSGSERLS